ncbi:hypothetical protein BDZ91DRAFT_670102 [Kalaharituber pfeilii]|nr:hypothetical protein BDZ91DRAFT_670102 [Kalaharituber pfeilii]
MSPYPLYSPPHRLAEIRDLYAALHASLLGIVNAWWTRPELYLSIPLPEKIEKILKKLDNVRKFDKVGSIRPDFIVPDDGGPVRICEVNARFIFNGFYLATFHGVGVDLVGREWCKDRGYSPGGTELNKHFTALFDPHKPIALVTGREYQAPWDLSIMQRLHPAARVVAAGDLRLVRSTTAATGPEATSVMLADSHGLLTQFLLELHQDEIEGLDEEVLFELGKHCWNDLRTIFLIHDKRILALIRRELKWLVNSSAITKEQAKILRNGLAETYILDESTCGSFLVNMKLGSEGKDQWTLKKARSGKGDGMLFGKDVDEVTWGGLIEKHSAGTGKEGGNGLVPYVLQRYVRSKQLDLLAHEPDILGKRGAKEHPVINKVRWKIVGTMLCINATLIPNTQWRANAADIVALSRGGFLLSAVGDKDHMVPFTAPATSYGRQLVALKTLVVPADRRIQAQTRENYAEQVKQVKQALERDELAVVNLEFQDKQSVYLVALTGMLGEPLSHSSKHGILWDVRPVAGLHAGNAARSETMEPFPWHTDCSFEDAPPRYFALHVLHRDRFGGGNLRLLHVDALLSKLSSTTVQTLRLPQFKLLVPKEFHKDVDYIVGALLTVDTATGFPKFKLRYRREIIEPLTPEAEKAVAELDKVLERVDTAGEHGPVRVLGGDIMRDGTILLLDNARWLHARSTVRDPQRFLRRVRWAPERFE